MTVSTSLRRRAAAAAVLALLAATLAWCVPAQARVAGLPSDPRAYGYIGFCNEAGQNVTGGSIDAHPFVWKAVSSTHPPANYQGPGENAVLNIYQPRPDTAPAYWSGISLTSASFYNTRNVPVIQATYADESLHDFMKQFPPKVNGLYQLRVFYGKANYGLYSAKYPVTTIQVTGTTWHVVSGGTVNCTKGKAISNEQLTGVVKKSQVVPHKPSAAQEVVQTRPGRTITAAPVAHARTAGSSSSASSPGDDSATNGSASPAAATASSAHSSSSGWVLWTLLALVAALAVALAVVLRARKPTSPTV
jgi:hypothetical protein